MSVKVVPVMLMILDGWGHGAPGPGNAISVARTPNMDQLMANYPFTTLVAHNGAVGLPEGQMGNSEVGHLNIGAGRVVYQDLTRINLAIVDGSLFNNEALLATMSQLRHNQGALHLMGLVSDGGVHSHIDHLVALVRMAAAQGLRRIFIHAFMDGRDTPPTSGASYIALLREQLGIIGAGRIASICGRFYAMDRDNRWERVERAWQAVVDGEADQRASDPVTAVQEAYRRGETDEFITPILITGPDGAVATINDQDAVLFFNFRADRTRQLVQAMIDPAFDRFPVRRRPKLTHCVTFTEYDKHFHLPVVFPPVSLTHILGEEVSLHQLRQLRIAETEKYAHVTYFFNGGREEPMPGEDRVLIPSPKEVATYDLKPAMSAVLVTEELLSRLDKEHYDLVVLNFANGDMVGHTGVMAAAVRACEAVDGCVGRLVARFTRDGGVVLITADHGNAEIMVDPQDGGPFTAHSCNPVPLILVSDHHRGRQLRGGGALQDIAPTVLALMGLPQPVEMTGTNLIE